MSSFFSPFTPNYVNLINACYPSSSALLASGSTCQPLPQELSRLTYYASNKAESSGKLAKLGLELEKRASAEARKAKSGNARARAQLLVTMSIFKALTNECKRDVGLFTKMLLSAVRDALLCLPNDLELQARVASLFTAWATFSDGGVIGPDAKATADYMTVLKTFRERCTVTGKDLEHVSRMRLIGIAAMTAAVSSDEFYTTPAQFSKQASIAVPALVSSLHEASTHLVTTESTVVSADPSPNSPFLTEFQPRPVMDRRAASIHAHVDGETGPELSDVVNASLRALRTLLGRCNGSQSAVVFDYMLQSVDNAKLWDNPDVGKWYAQHVIEWTQYQYRYAIPTHLVDRLLSMQDSPSATPKLFVTVEMLISIFNSSTPLINLSTSDIITSLITVLLRRVSIDSNDGLLVPLVDCISSLGTHVYYADQIHDLAEEVVGRLVNVEINGVLGRGRGGNEAARETALRCLLACLSGLTEAADRNAAKYFAKLAEDGDTSTPAETTEGERPPSESTSTTIRAARRNKVSPESWQETLALLCESNYGIRAMYARGLTKFIQKEVKREPFVQSVDSSSQLQLRRTPRVIVDPEFKASSRPSILASDSVSRFLNALHATIYTLATSSSTTKSRNEAEGPSVNIIPPSSSNLPTPNDIPPPLVIDFVVKPPSTTPSLQGNGDHRPPTATSAASTASSFLPGGSEVSPMTPGGSQKRGSRQPNGSRKLSNALNLLDGSQLGVTSTLSDFAFLLEILMSTHRQVPTRAVLTGVPLLIALEKWTRKSISTDSCHPGCLRAVREVVCHVWIVIGEVWDVPSVVENASKALNLLKPDILPDLDPVPATQLDPPEQPVEFPASENSFITNQTACVDAEITLPALASSAGLQAITGLDRQGLLRRFMIEWSVEGALKDSVEQTSNQDILRGDAPFLRLSPALMHIENMSLASLARSTGGGVGVNDLREALGRGSVSNPALATASLNSTLDRNSSMMRRMDKDGNHPEPLAITRIKSKRGRAPPSEVRDVLNKLGIGKQTSGGTTLRTPFLQSSSESSKADKAGLKRDTSSAEPPY